MAILNELTVQRIFMGNDQLNTGSSKTNWSPYALDEYFAPSMSVFTSVDIITLEGNYPEAGSLINFLILNSIFGVSYSDDAKRKIFQFVRKVESAFSYYHKAKVLTEEYLLTYKPSVNKYYDALECWEIVVLQLQMGFDIVKRTIEKPLFSPNDNSAEKRINNMANDIKHYGERKEGWLPIWLDNSGLRSSNGQVLYSELTNVIDDMMGAIKILISVKPPTE
jgi:hypothetical protein